MVLTAADYKGVSFSLTAKVHYVQKEQKQNGKQTEQSILGSRLWQVFRVFTLFKDSRNVINYHRQFLRVVHHSWSPVGDMGRKNFTFERTRKTFGQLPPHPPCQSLSVPLR